MSARDRAAGRRLRRKAGTRSQIPVFHLYVEGEVTEVEYFTALGRCEELREKVKITIERAGGQPKPLVAKAVKDARQAAKAIRQYDDHGMSDQYWCVFDDDMRVTEPGSPTTTRPRRWICSSRRSTRRCGPSLPREAVAGKRAGRALARSPRLRRWSERASRAGSP